VLNWLCFCLIANSLLSDGATLSGTIRDEQGNPLAGATVSMFTAKPREGVGTICPSCYTDCRKYATSDGQGQFAIEGLDAELFFTVLVVAPGHRSHLTHWLDPLAGPLDVKLQPYPKNLPPLRSLSGRVIDPDGKPVAGAVVNAVGAKTPEQHLFGLLRDVDRAAVTDAFGFFLLTTQEPKLGLDVRVSAPGFAVSPSQHFELHQPAVEIQLMRGASVSGTLMQAGQPVPHRAIGIVQTNRSHMNFSSERVMGTDELGQFQFVDLQPNEPYVLYTICLDNVGRSEGEPARGVLKNFELTTPYAGRSTDVGELTLIPGLSLVGQIVVPAGQALPAQATVRLGRDPAWDYCEVVVGENGTFEFHGLPAEVYSVRVLADGYDLDASRLRFQATGPMQFGLRLRSDHDAAKRIEIPLRAVAGDQD
jgi:hypothetical protein